MNRSLRFTSLNHSIVHYFNRLWPVLVISISAWIVWADFDEGKSFDWVAIFAALGLLVIGHFFGRFVEWLFFVQGGDKETRQDLDR